MTSVMTYVASGPSCCLVAGSARCEEHYDVVITAIRDGRRCCLIRTAAAAAAAAVGL